MVMFDANVSSGGDNIDIAAWLEASSSGQPGGVDLGVNYPSGGTSGVIKSLPGDRALLIGYNSSNYPFVQIGTKTPSVGTAVVVVSSAVNVLRVERCRANKSRFLIIVNNDVYLIDCGLSGTTVTVTNVASDAGDAGRGESLTDRAWIRIAEDDSHFVILNEFNNAGTRSFVSALYTISYSGTPAATYVTRDVDATGGTADLTTGGTFSGYTSTPGTVFICGANTTESSDLRFNRVTFTSSTVLNSVTTVALSTAYSTANAQMVYASQNFEDIDRCIIRYTVGGNCISATLSYGGAPTLLSTTSGGTVVFTNESLAYFDADPLLWARGTGSTTISVDFGSRNSAGTIICQTAALITGITGATVKATGFDETGDYLFIIGRSGSDVGRLWVVKNTNV